MASTMLWTRVVSTAMTCLLEEDGINIIVLNHVRLWGWGDLILPHSLGALVDATVLAPNLNG